MRPRPLELTIRSCLQSLILEKDPQNPEGPQTYQARVWGHNRRGGLRVGKKLLRRIRCSSRAAAGAPLLQTNLPVFPLLS